MKPDNWNRFAAGLLAILLCLCSFSMPAFASGSDPAPEPLPEIIEEEPTTGGMEPEGVPITPKGKGRRTNLSDGPCRRSQGRGKGTESQEVPRRKTEKAVHPGTA